MEAKSSQFGIKLLPSFSDFAFLMPLVFLFGRMGGLKTLLSDGDTGWHIRTGEWIAANRAVPTVDMFSFSRPGEPWFAWEWLSDVLFAWLNAMGGLRAVSLFAVVMLGLTFTLLFRLVQRKSNPIVAICITMLAAAASGIHWLARPHLFTLLFLVLFYSLLENFRDGRTRMAGIPRLAVLPVLTVLWTNLHGGFISGIIMIAAYGCGELVHMAFTSRSEERPQSWRNARAYFLTAGACLAASLINPYTYHLHVHMAAYLRDPWNSINIMEFLSPSFHHPLAIFFEAMLVLSVVTICANVAKGRFIEPVLMVVWAHGALLANRNIPIFMIVAAPAVAAAIQEWLLRAPEMNVAGWLRSAAQKFNRIAADTSETEALGRWHLVRVAALVVIAALIWAPNPPKSFRAEFDPSRYPAAALVALQDTSARIFTTDEWGDYLIWRLYPSHRVFVDGRSDFYGNAFEEKYTDVIKVKYDWEKTLSRFGVNTILMPPDAPLTGALKQSGRWNLVYDDGVAVVFRSAPRAEGKTNSVTLVDGASRGREVTKIETSERPVMKTKTKT